MSATTDLSAVTTGSLVAVLRFADSDSDNTYSLLSRWLIDDTPRTPSYVERLRTRFSFHPDPEDKDEDVVEAEVLDEGADEAEPASLAELAYFRSHLYEFPTNPKVLHFSMPVGAGPTGLDAAERTIRSVRILMEYADALADGVRLGQSSRYRLVSLSKASPTQVVLEFAPYAAVPLTVGLLTIVNKLMPVAEKIATFKARTNATNKAADLRAALSEAAIDQVHQGKVDALAHIARRENLVMPSEIEILDPAADGAELVDLLPHE